MNMELGIILAGGKGSRMGTSKPKGSIMLIDKPMIEYVYDSISKVVNGVLCVVGYRSEDIKEILGDKVSYVTQEKQLGSFDALKCAVSHLSDVDDIIVTMCDLPLIDSKVYNDLKIKHIKSEDDITIVTMIVDKPYGYGRVIGGKIVEECMLEGKSSNEVFTGVMAIKVSYLKKVLEMIKPNNPKGEYFITDLTLFTSNINTLLINPKKGFGVNDLKSLNKASQIMNENKKESLLDNGVVINGEVLIGSDVEIGEGTVVYQGCYISGKTIIGKNNIIGPNSIIDNSIIGDNNRIEASKLANSKIMNNTTVGPFAHIRDESIILGENRIGNFVEIKKSSIGKFSKLSHLSYMGDTTCGKNVNFGCGAITVNYDGKSKHQTTIGDNTFIGSNSNLIAPIEIKKGSLVGAGSTIYEDVEEDSLAIARSYQINKNNYYKKQ
jgi:bifunctional UDP-N-acetylglucosamine pyrophosphorylase/glucosamine-1-phosphate N-acetyltransferase